MSLTLTIDGSSLQRSSSGQQLPARVPYDPGGCRSGTGAGRRGGDDGQSEPAASHTELEPLHTTTDQHSELCQHREGCTPGLYSNASAFALASANAAFAFALAFECPEVGAFAFALAFES